MRSFISLCLLALTLAPLASLSASSSGPLKRPIKAGKIRKNKNYYVRPGVSAAELLRARGYLAREYRFKTKDGYVLTIIRGTNPLINEGKRGLAHKDPILFVHGSISSAPIWLLNSKGARPQDWSSLDVNRLRLRELNELIGHYDSARSMPMLCMNFGYEVWLLNRRGFSQSEQRAGHLNRTWTEVLASLPGVFFGGGKRDMFEMIKEFGMEDKVGPEVIVHKLERAHNLEQRRDLVQEFWLQLLSQVKPLVDLPQALHSFGELKMRIWHSFDPEYWSFSFDEQADYDFPQAIQFVLHKTRRKRLIVFTHSAAAPIALMSLSTYPELSEKISRLINWGSCVNTGTKTDAFPLLRKITPLIHSYLGPIPFAFMTMQVQSLLQNICSTELRQRTVCESLLDPFFGPGHGQQSASQFVLANILQPTSSREIQHILQMSRTQRPRRFNFGSPEANWRAYANERPPVYDFGRIRQRNLMFHVGADDAVSSPDMLKITVDQLSVPYKLVVVNETGVHYNHAGAFTHDQTTRLTNLPSLMEIERPLNDERGYDKSYLLNSLDGY